MGQVMCPLGPICLCDVQMLSYVLYLRAEHDIVLSYAEFEAGGQNVY